MSTNDQISSFFISELEKVVAYWKKIFWKDTS